MNDLGSSGGRYLLWPAWILFSLGITLFLTAYLAGVGSDYSRDEQSSGATGLASTTPVLRQWGSFLVSSLPLSLQDVDFVDLLVKAAVLALWAIYIASTYQIHFIAALMFLRSVGL